MPISYTKRDLLIYSVGIGCDEEKFTYELDKDFQMFPTFPMCLFFDVDARLASGMAGGNGVKGHDGTDPIQNSTSVPLAQPGSPEAKAYNVLTGVDGERYIELVKPLPVEGGNFNFRTENTAVIRRGGGKGISSEYRSSIEDASGQVYFKFWGSGYSIGGQGGVAEFDNAGVSGAITTTAPGRAPDATERFTTSPLQSLMYRIAGDLNNIHVDKTLAKELGYVDAQGNGKPILQGLGFMGIGARAALKHFGKNDAKAFHSCYVRFSAKVLPGQTLETRMWDMGPGSGTAPGTRKVIFSTFCVETGEMNLSNAFMDLKESEFGPEDTSKDTWRAKL